ncbi:MAG: type II secretion system protein, partial [Akkermansiaceae bacterium]
MKMTKHNMAKGFTLVELLVVIAIIAALAALSTPVVLKQQKKAALAEAINNAKQIGYLMKDYDDQFGSFPPLNNTDGTTTAVPAS